MLQYDIYWLVQKRVLVYRLDGDYDLEIMRLGAQDVHQHVLTGQPPVHLIIDTTNLTSPSADFRGPMNDLQEYRGQQEMGWTVLVASSALVRFFGNVAARLLQTNFRIAYSFDEAVSLLWKLDPLVEQAASLPISPDLTTPPER